MKVTNDSIVELTPSLADKLAIQRELRAFDPELWLQKKIALVADYFARSKLDAAVVGVSGGIDSALVLAILREVERLPDSPLRKIVPLIVPASGDHGATGQDTAASRALALCEALDLKPAVVPNFGKIVREQSAGIESALGLDQSPWARGQLVSSSRTPLFYGAVGLLADAGYSALVVGTTNLSEGGYIGFFGKTCDTMVDLQFIADLYKSEVYAVADLLPIPREIVAVRPSGDMFDGRPDEVVFGASYDFLELYMGWLSAGSPADWLDDSTFATGAAHLEKLHSYNDHKYTVGYPSIFLTVNPCAIPGGWTMGVAR